MAETRRIAELDSNGTLKPDQVPAGVVHQADLGPAAAMTPAEVVTDEDAQAALSATFVDVQDTLYGGKVPAPLRAPAITPTAMWPQPGQSFRPIYAHETNSSLKTFTLYAIGADSTVYRSTNNGRTWSVRGNPGVMLGAAGTFWRLSSGSLLSYALVGSDYVLYRSTDDGQNWSAVLTLPDEKSPLGVGGLVQDENTGDVYAIEYKGEGAAAIAAWNVYRSTDDGATWDSIHTFAGQAVGTGDFIRHIHAVQWDPISERVFVFTGDSEAAAGIYRINADGDGVEKVIRNDETPTSIPYAASIQAMFFPDYIAWGSDNIEPRLLRIPRTAIGNATADDVEFIYDLGGLGWNTVRASDDGSTWLLFTSNEEPVSGRDRLDRCAHIYVVEAQGSRVWDAGTFGSEPGVSIGYLLFQPLGPAHKHGDVFWVQTRGTRTMDAFAFQGVLNRGGLPFPRPVAPTPKYDPWQTHTSGAVQLTASSTVPFAVTKAPATKPTLFIFDLGTKRTEGSGANRVQVWNRTTGTQITGTISAVSQREASKIESAEYYTAFTVSPGDEIEFRIMETGGMNTATASAFVTFAWGSLT